MTNGALSVSDGWVNNPLKSRADVLRAAATLLAPLLPKYSPKKSAIQLIASGAHFDVLAAQLEGFSRVIWAVAAIKAGWEDRDSISPEVESVIHDFELNFQGGVASGSDPESDEYWGYPDDCDQRLVEMAALGFALFMCPAVFWIPLPENVKKNLAQWLYAINEVDIVNNNWLFFRVLVNVGLRTVGEIYSDHGVNNALDRIDTFYLADGWYFDGKPSQLDYYVPFAFHFYGLVYSVHATWDPKRGALYRERAAVFADDFAMYFSPAGAGIPFGRSLTYRFAQAAFWAAMAYAGVEGAKKDAVGSPIVSTGVIKHLLLQNLRYWSKRPFLLDDGSFSVGYAYPNLLMSEEYNSANSPYWAMKSMLALAIPSANPFWTTAELALTPPLTKVLSHAGQIVVNDAYGHTYALSAGQYADWFRCQKAKYCKFAYSASFGFSVSGANESRAHFAGDSYLAITNDDEVFVGPGIPLQHGIDEINKRNVVWARYSSVLNKTVQVSSWLIPPAVKTSAWHTRIHKIENLGLSAVSVAEGGFSVSSQTPAQRPIRVGAISASGMFKTAGKDFALVKSPAGVSGIKTSDVLVVEGKAQVTDPNTNILFPRAVLPSVEYVVEGRSTKWIVDHIFAIPGSADVVSNGEWISLWKNVPDVTEFVTVIKNL